MVEEDRTPWLLQEIERLFYLLPQDPLSFVRDTRSLPVLSPEGVRVDFIFARLPFEQQAVARSEAAPMAGVLVKVATAEDPKVMKRASTRARDWEDARAILSRQREVLDLAYLLLERPEQTTLVQEELQKV